MTNRFIRVCRGFSLLEVLFATAVLTIGAGSLAELAALSVRANRGSRNMTLSSVLAAQKMEQLRSLSWGGDAAATELRASPAGTLQHDTPGFIDFIDASGRTLATDGSIDPPVGTVFIRRWAVQPLPANPAGCFVFQVAVATMRDEARLVAVRTKRSDW